MSRVQPSSRGSDFETAFQVDRSVYDKILLDHARDGTAYDATVHSHLVQCLEAMARDGWVKCKKYSGATPIRVDFLTDNGFIESDRDEAGVA